MNERVQDKTEPMWSLAIAWILLVPLLYLCGHGSFFFQHSLGNSVLENSQLAGDARTGAEHLQSQIAILFALVVTCAIVIRSFAAVLDVCKQNHAFVILVLVAFLSASWSQQASLSLYSALLLTLNVLFAFYLSRRFSTQRQMQLMLMLGWIAIALSFLLAFAFPSVGIDQREGVGAWQGISVQKNSCAILMAYLMSPVLFVKASSIARRMRSVVYASLCIYVAVMTQSRTGWIVIALLLAFAVLWRGVTRFASKERTILLLVIATFGLCVVAVSYFYLPLLLTVLGKDPTLTGRLPLWSLVVSTAMKHPILGYGYNAFWRSTQGEAENISLILGWYPTHAQNGFLDTWLQLGAVGVGLVVWTLYRAFKDAAVCLQSRELNRIGWYCSLLFITILSNLDERSLMYPNFLEFVLYILACVGIADEARRIRGQQGRVRALRGTSDILPALRRGVAGA